MSFINLSLKRPVFAWMLMTGLILFGAISFNKLGVSQMPDVNFPVLSVSLSYPGAAPEVIESEILDKVEARLLAVEGIQEMKSTAEQGSGRISLEFDINKNIDVALQEVQTALSSLRLPEEVDPPVIRKTNPEEDPIIFMALYGDKPSKELIQYYENTFLDQIQLLPGVGEVTTPGFANRNLRVWIDVQKLKIYELTVSDVIEAVRTHHFESAAGSLVNDKREVRARFVGENTTPEGMAKIPILRRGGQTIQDKSIYVGNVATIEDGLTDVRRVGLVQGQNALSVQIRKQRGTNEVVVAERVLAAIKEIKLPEGIQYRVNVDYTQNTKAVVGLTQEKMIMASVITMLICLLFLGNIQSAVNVLFSIPTSVFGTFIILKLSGFTLNIFTLLALTLAISIVVDDAIMILENIVRHQRMGKSAYRAALDGATEVLPSAIAATLAVLAVFMPVMFMDGVIGKFLFQFGVTMSAAVMISLVEAVTITPMRSAALLRMKKGETKFEMKLEHLFEKWGLWYRSTLEFALRFRVVIVVGSLVVFIVSLFLINKVKQEFVPSQDQSILILSAQGKPGTSMEETRRMAEPLIAAMNNIAEVEGYLVSIGPASLFMPITLKPKEDRKLGHLAVMDIIREKAKEAKGLRVSIRDVSTRSLTTGRQNPVSFNIRGPDFQVLQDKAQEIIKRLEAEKLAVDLDTDYKLGLPELRFQPNREEMKRKGVTVEALSQVVEATLAGYRIGQFSSEGKRIDIRYKILDDQIRQIEDFRNIMVRNNFGNMIPITDLVTMTEVAGTQSITRINRQRSLSVYGNLSSGQSQAVVLQKTRDISTQLLPAGYSFNLEGASAGFQSSFQNLWLVILIGLVVAYMILATQYNSFRDPLTVLMALPFSVTGALLVLWMTNLSLNLYSFIGIIVLMGIAKKNSILLVDFANQVSRNKKVETNIALLEACPVRLRPILMTSIATVFAALPLIWGNSLGIETRKPMGLVIIGGMIVSTVFTLYVIPCLHSILHGAKTVIRDITESET